MTPSALKPSALKPSALKPSAMTPSAMTPSAKTNGAMTPGATTGNLNGGAAATVRVSIDRPGAYPFPCVYHASSGMLGTLVITE